MKSIDNKPRVRMDEIGLYLRTIEAEYRPKTNQERADLITQFFDVLCLPEDIEHYEQLYEEFERYKEKLLTDWELESRRESYFSQINRINPFN